MMTNHEKIITDLRIENKKLTDENMELVAETVLTRIELEDITKMYKELMQHVADHLITEHSDDSKMLDVAAKINAEHGKKKKSKKHG